MINKILIVLIMTFSLFGCKESKRKGNFSVTAPGNWIVKDTVDKDNERHIKMYPPFSSSTPVFVENIIIGIVRSSNIHHYINAVISSVKKEAVYFEEKGSGTTKINQYKAEWQQYVIQVDHNAEIVEQLTYFISDHGNIYEIVCSAKANKLPKMKNEMDTVLNSFKIL